MVEIRARASLVEDRWWARDRETGGQRRPLSRKNWKGEREREKKERGIDNVNRV